MASTRAQQAQILRNQTVIDQLAGALLAAAWNVTNEAATTANHDNRLKWANAILSAPTQQASMVAPSLMTNATLAGQAGDANGPSGTPFNDSDVDYFVSTVFDKYATFYSEQLNIGAALTFGA